jgi:hypothetical protein
MARSFFLCAMGSHKDYGHSANRVPILADKFGFIGEDEGGRFLKKAPQKLFWEKFFVSP